MKLRTFLLASLAALPLTLAAQTDDAPRRIPRISGGVMAGQLLTRVQPVYPPEAKAQGISGAVVLHAIIGKDGNIENLTAISGADLLREAALEAVAHWTYRPYLLNGEPTEVDTQIVVNFNLDTPASSATAPAAVPDSHNKLIRVSGGVAQGLRIQSVAPIYPIEAKRSHIQGTVVLHVVIDPNGSVQVCDPVSGPVELQDAAVTSVRQWTYRPYVLNGEPVSVETQVTINFNLAD